MSAKYRPDKEALPRKASTTAVTVATPPPQGSPSSPDVNAWWDNAWHWVANIVKRLLEHTQIEATDVTQTVMVKAFEGLRQFRGEAQFKTWLYKIAIRTVRDYRDGIRPDLMSFDELNTGQEDLGPSFEPAAPTVDFVTYLYAEEQLSSLSSRDALILRAYSEGETSEEIGARLDMQAPAVRQRIHKSLDSLWQSQQERTNGFVNPDRKGARRERARRHRDGSQQK
jgi:RNA polymerase sigma-70 factor (ECF subfamily)